MRMEYVAGRTARSLVCVGLLLIVLPGRLAHSQSAPRDEAEAWTWMQESLKSSDAKFTNIKMENYVVTGQIKGGATVPIYLRRVSSASKSNPTSMYNYAIVTWYEFPNVASGPGHVSWSSFGRGADHDAQKFVLALVYLARAAQQKKELDEAAYLSHFPAMAAAWQQMPVKPAMPEEAQRHEVLAEYAYKNKDIPKAILEYEAALSIFPYWPDGHSNLANLAAAVGTRPGYNMAVYHMKMYLMLVPNAPDAKAAQDSIFIWEDKRNSATP